MFHVSHQTDHKALVFILKLGSTRPDKVGSESYWKLNSAVLKDKRLRRNFEKLYSKVVIEKDFYDFPF